MSTLAEMLPHSASAGAVRLWLKSSAYTRRLLLGSEQADPWENAAGYLAYFVQAHGLLRPDVAVVEVGELIDAWCARDGGLAARLGNRRRPATALRKLLESEAPKAVLAEVVTAVLSHLRGQTPLVLSMPSPRAWLLHANRLAGGTDDEIDADTVEDAAMYVADLIRSVSAFPVAGLLLEEQRDDQALEAAHIERYRSVLNVAGHYRWSLALRLPSGVRLPPEIFDGFAAVIGDGNERPGHSAFGRDDSAAFAMGIYVGPLAQEQFHFVEINPQQQPEAVLEQLARLRACAA
ncbi:hypothetical protein [Acidovorax sp.]|jgi:hypothetical protein|uniref:hypothetical protein n=1 Tax=Acidovorax sp. TaxID=1872122 RepID=UPI0025C70060|nr:hypothetical protein [Acidovorax sp.]